MAAESSKIHFTLNEKPIEVENPDPQQLLVHWLRESGYTGTKVRYKNMHDHKTLGNMNRVTTAHNRFSKSKIIVDEPSTKSNDLQFNFQRFTCPVYSYIL